MEKIKAKPRNNYPVESIWLDVNDKTAWELTEKTEMHDIWTKLPKEAYEIHMKYISKEQYGK